MLKEAATILQRNLPVVLLYLAAAGALSALRLTGDWLVFGAEFGDTRSGAQQGYLVMTDIGMALATAAVQVLVFNALGAATDRPLWKQMPWREAFARFYQLWLILNLLILASFQLINWFTGIAGEGSGASLFLLWLFLISFVLPYGTAVMFHRDARRSELRLAALTLIDQFPRLLLILLLYFGVNALIFAVFGSGSIPIWARPALVIVQAYFDCLVFVYVWLLCMLQRDHPRDDDDWDF